MMNEYVSKTNTPEDGQYELVFHTDSYLNYLEVQNFMRRIVDRNRDPDYEEDKNIQDGDVYMSLTEGIKEFRSVLKSPETRWVRDKNGYLSQQVLNWLLELRQYRKSSINPEQIVAITEAVQSVAKDNNTSYEYVLGCLLRVSQLERLNLIQRCTAESLEIRDRALAKSRQLLVEFLNPKTTKTREELYNETMEMLCISDSSSNELVDLYEVGKEIVRKDLEMIAKDYQEIFNKEDNNNESDVD